MGLFEIIFYEGAFWSYMELNVFKINFWKLYVSIEGAPDEELTKNKCGVPQLLHSNVTMFANNY